MATNANTEKTYLDLISVDEKTVQKDSLKIVAQEAALELNKQILTLSTEISKKKTELEKLKRQVPYSIIAEYNTTKQLEKLEEQLEFAKTIREVRFNDAAI